MATSEPCDGCTLGRCPILSSCPADRAADALLARREHLAELEERLRDEDRAQGRRPFGTSIGEAAMSWKLDLRTDTEQQRDRAARARELRARVERATKTFIRPLFDDLRPDDDEG